MALRKPLMVLTLLVVAGVLVAVGDVDEAVGLSSVFEVWGDLLRDADHVGLRVTRVSDAEEMELGAALARNVSWGSPGATGQARYVSAVGRALTHGLRRPAIRYEFHVLQASEPNAFALPGGHVFVFSGMLELLESEAELAAILGHEISHVDLGHCIERYRYQIAADKLGVAQAGRLVDLARSFVAVGYDNYQETEADEHAFRLMVLADYDPTAEIAVFERLSEQAGERARTEAASPVEEVVGAMAEAVESYFRTHPYSHDRARRLSALIEKNRGRLADREFYRGVRNLELQRARSEQEYSNEWVEVTSVTERR